MLEREERGRERETREKEREEREREREREGGRDRECALAGLHRRPRPGFGGACSARVQVRLGQDECP